MTETTIDVLDEQVGKELAKENITDKKIAQLQEDYAELAVTPIKNDEQLEVYRLAAKDCQKTRTATEKICKAGRADAIRIQGIWIDKEKTIKAEIAKVEDPIDAHIEAYKLIAIERQKKEEAEKKLPIRTKLLEGAGIISTPDEFQFLSDTEFLDFFNTKAEEKKVLEEAQKAKEANDKLIEEGKRKAAEDALKNAYKDVRDKSLRALGFNRSELSQRYIFEIMNVGVWEVHFNEAFDCDDAKFDALYATSSKEVERLRKQKADMDAEATRKRIEAETLAKIEADKKAQAVADEKAKLAEIKKKALLPDKQKLQEFVDSLKWDYPIVSTEAGQAIIARAKYLIDTSKKDLQAKINAL